MGWSVVGYEAVELIGRGGLGEVWRGREVGTTATVALKRIRMDAADADRELLRREARGLVAVRHPGLVTMHAVVAGRDCLVLVLEYAARGDLRRVLATRERLSVPEVVGLLVPVGRALAEAHRCGVVHGDVSTGNVLVRQDGSAALADLATVRLAGRDLDRRLVTPWYADPLVAGGGAPDRASDVFSLAAVCRHLVTGVPLWQGDDPAEVLAAAERGLRRDATDREAALPPALRDLLTDTLLSAREARPTAEEFAERLASVCAPDVLAVGERGPRPGPVMRPAETIDVPGTPASGAPTPAGGRDSARRRGRRRPWLGRRGSGRTRHGLRGSGRRGPRSPWPRRILTGAGVTSVVLCAAVAGVLAWSAVPDAGAGREADAPQKAAPQQAAPSAPSPMTDADWMPVVRDLVGRRSLAYGTGDPGVLDRVYVKGAEGLEMERAQIARFASSGGGSVEHHVVSVHAESADASRAVLTVVETVPLHTPTPGAAADPAVRTIRLTLTHGPAGWLIADVREA